MFESMGWKIKVDHNGGYNLREKVTRLSMKGSKIDGFINSCDIDVYRETCTNLCSYLGIYGCEFNPSDRTMRYLDVDPSPGMQPTISVHEKIEKGPGISCEYYKVDLRNLMERAKVNVEFKDTTFTVSNLLTWSEF